jgi:hypothetical protein
MHRIRRIRELRLFGVGVLAEVGSLMASPVNSVLEGVCHSVEADYREEKGLSATGPRASDLVASGLVRTRILVRIANRQRHGISQEIALASNTSAYTL